MTCEQIRAQVQKGELGEIGKKVWDISCQIVSPKEQISNCVELTEFRPACTAQVKRGNYKMSKFGEVLEGKR